MTTIEQQRPLSSGFDSTSTASQVLSGVELDGRTAVVTGGTSGLGLQSATALAAAGARVIVLSRRVVPTVLFGRAAERVEVIDGVDLGDLGSVRRAAERVASLVPGGIDLLITAAGVMATPLRRTGPGWESQLAVNHLGHFVLVARLYHRLASGGARVVVYSSAGHQASDIRWTDPHFRSGYDKWLAYGQSKTANSLFAVHLDQIGRADGVRAFALHPGKIITGLQRDLSRAEQIELGWVDAAGQVIGAGFRTPEQGAATGLWAATSGMLDGRGGLYLEDCDVARLATAEGPDGEGGVRPYAIDPDNADRLWCLSAALTATDVRR